MRARMPFCSLLIGAWPWRHGMACAIELTALPYRRRAPRHSDDTSPRAHLRRPSGTHCLTETAILSPSWMAYGPCSLRPPDTIAVPEMRAAFDAVVFRRRRWSGLPMSSLSAAPPFVVLEWSTELVLPEVFIGPLGWRYGRRPRHTDIE